MYLNKNWNLFLWHCVLFLWYFLWTQDLAQARQALYHCTISSALKTWKLMPSLFIHFIIVITSLSLILATSLITLLQFKHPFSKTSFLSPFSFSPSLSPPVCLFIQSTYAHIGLAGSSRYRTQNNQTWLQLPVAGSFGSMSSVTSAESQASEAFKAKEMKKLVQMQNEFLPWKVAILTARFLVHHYKVSEPTNFPTGYLSWRSGSCLWVQNYLFVYYTNMLWVVEFQHHHSLAVGP